MSRLVTRLALLMSLSLAISITLIGQQPSPATALPIHPIDSKDYTDPDQFAFLSSTLNGVEVVALGESIHMTHEFPLVRLGIIRCLNENMGFHVLAMEGSAEDIWLAQDIFLNSTHSQADEAEATRGLFGLWNTPEMHQLFHYESASWTSANPFYVTSYDIQPGTGRGWRGPDVFRMLTERLKTYSPAPKDLDLTQWMADLSRLTSDCRDYRPGDQARVEKAIQNLQLWIYTVAPEIQKRFPKVAHNIALSLVPENLRASLQLCKDLSAADGNNYKAHRDTNNAPYALELKAAVPTKKLILWGHISHLSHNDEHTATSTGEILHRTIGQRLYTIGPFAQSGGADVIFLGNGGNDDVGYGRVHGEYGALAQRLSELSRHDYFLDFRQSGISAGNDPTFVSPQPLPVESERWQLAVARDFDGIIWIKTIHPPAFPFPQSLIFSAMHYETALIVIGGALVLGIIFSIVRRIRRRRRMRAA